MIEHFSAGGSIIRIDLSERAHEVCLKSEFVEIKKSNVITVVRSVIKLHCLPVRNSSNIFK